MTQHWAGNVCCSVSHFFQCNLAYSTSHKNLVLFSNKTNPWNLDQRQKSSTFKYHVSCTDGKILVRIIYFNYFFAVVPLNSCVSYVPWSLNDWWGEMFVHWVILSCDGIIWAGIWRRLCLVFWSPQVCLFSYGYFQGVLWTWFLLLFSFHVVP